ICLRALEKDAARRFATAGDMARDLRRYAEDFPIVSRRIGPIGRTARWMRRHPARTMAISAIALVALLAPVAFMKAKWLREERADRAIDQTIDVLLDNYRASGGAMKQLRPALDSGIDADRARFVEAFALVLDDPKRCIELLHPLVQKQRAFKFRLKD